MNETVLQALDMMWKGMLGIFVALTVIMIFVWIMAGVLSFVFTRFNGSITTDFLSKPFSYPRLTPSLTASFKRP